MRSMNDSADSRVERDTSQTKTSTPNAVALDRRKFMFVLGGGLVISQISCSPSQVSIVESAGTQAQGADIETPTKLPEGALRLSVTTEDGTPVGVLQDGNRILFCIGEDLCELARVSQGEQSVCLDDTIVDETKARDAIGNIGLSEDKSLIVESDFGSLSIDVDAQKHVAEELRKAILQMRATGVRQSLVVIDDVTYSLQTKGLRTAAYYGAQLFGVKTPPLNGGTCSVSVMVLPKETKQPRTGA